MISTHMVASTQIHGYNLQRSIKRRCMSVGMRECAEGGRAMGGGIRYSTNFKLNISLACACF